MTKRIVVRLQGGLGNQMFQYAAAKSIALKNETNLFLDTSFLEDNYKKDNFTHRDYELSVYQIKDSIIDKIKLQLFLNKVNLISFI